MVVVKRFNNNVILAKANNQEKVLIGKGLGFQVYPGDLVDEELIEQVFLPTDSFELEGIVELLCNSTTTEVELVREIINHGEKLLNKKLNKNLMITLLDHLHFAIVRHEKQMETKSPIDWEVRQMYRLETTIGVRAIKLVNEELSIELPQSEAVFIAMHFINAQFENETMGDTMEFSETMKQVNSIVKYHFQIKIDEQSVNYNRFLTHLRYYLIRQKNHESIELGNDDVYFTMKNRFPDESDCVDKISLFIEKKYQWKTTLDEKLYLILHINRLIS